MAFRVHRLLGMVLSPLAATVVLGALCGFTAGALAGEQPAGAPRQRLSPFEIEDVAGKVHRYDWGGGDKEKATHLVFFYEPRSPAALREMDWLNSMYRFASDRGLEIIAIEGSGLNAAEATAALQRFAQVYAPVEYLVTVDTNYAASRLFGVRRLPKTCLLASDGTVLFQVEGFSEEFRGQLTKQIVAALQADKDNTAIAVEPGTVPGAAEADVTPEAAPPAVAANRIERGGAMPRIELVALDGGKHPLGPVPGVKATVVFFWGAVCLPCMQEMTFYNQLYRELRGQGLRVLAVQASGLDADGTAKALKRYQRLFPKLEYPVVPDPAVDVGKAFGVTQGGTMTYIANAEGTVVTVYDEFRVDQQSETLRTLSRALGADAAALGRIVNPGLPQEPGSGETEEAKSVLTQISIETAQKQLERGDQHYEKSEYVQAVPYYEEYLKARPGDVAVHVRLALVYEQIKEYHKAMAEWQAVLRVSSKNDEATRQARNKMRKLQSR